MAFYILGNKGNNKITKLRTILQRESQNSSLYKQTQTKSVNNRKTVRMEKGIVQQVNIQIYEQSEFCWYSSVLCVDTNNDCFTASVIYVFLTRNNNLKNK